MTKIVDIVGARPQFIKASAIWKAYQHFPNSDIEPVMVHTGQHYDKQMSDVFFSELGIPAPLYNLGISHSRHGAMTGRMLESIERILIKQKPDWVIVYGDTNSTLAGALAAKKLNIAIAHVEAGLRSFNQKMPEETNRILVDHCSDLLFTPTREATEQCRKEGIAKDRVIEVGDVMVDVLERYRHIEPLHFPVEDMDGSEPYVLVTIHRASNTDSVKVLKKIIKMLSKVADKYPIVWPCHPRTKKKLEEFSLIPPHNKIDVVNPVGYLSMVQLMQRSAFVITDSGGLQKEAALLGNPVLVARKETEWVELVKQGFVKLLGENLEEIEKGMEWVENRPDRYSPTCYGDGQAALSIVQEILDRSAVVTQELV